ncbi:hypothetical protein CJJ23_02320 [Mycoplasmopsis agassizii]|uniref:Uncharacterized protein n=1 Tax=Mycoplasmopsis agassizii TaxID=33922 RepID=A0A269TIP2_9BACT|nr:hypothetical protein [Mycoplasmopsis agassizii]PAK21353.1 hypothetical protein CJJ23_02320 [Mycoplasmopsis agassizii]
MSKDKSENKFLRAIKTIKSLPATLATIRRIITWIFKNYNANITKSVVTQFNDASGIQYDLQIKGDLKKPDIETIFTGGGDGKGGTDNSGIDPKIVKYIDQKNQGLESKLVTTMNQKNQELKNELIQIIDQKNLELKTELVATMDRKIDEVRKESREQNEILNQKIDEVRKESREQNEILNQKIDEVRQESREQNEKLNKKIDDRFDQLLEAIKNIKK